MYSTSDLFALEYRIEAVAGRMLREAMHGREAACGAATQNDQYWSTMSKHAFLL